MIYQNIIPGFECDKKTAPRPIKKEIAANKIEPFSFKLAELFHEDLYGSLPTAGETPLPVLEPYMDIYPKRLVPFHEAYAKKDYDCTIHFYIFDKHFLRVLRNPMKYLDFFKKCHSVIGTDLSQYANMSADERYYSAYINRAFTLFLQKNGVKIIPNVTWSLPDSYSYSFTGLPQNSAIAINCTGIKKYATSKYLWRKGYEEACNTLNPSIIIRYGSIMDGEYREKSLYFENNILKRLHNGSSRKF